MPVFHSGWDVYPGAAVATGIAQAGPNIRRSGGHPFEMYKFPYNFTQEIGSICIDNPVVPDYN